MDLEAVNTFISTFKGSMIHIVEGIIAADNKLTPKYFNLLKIEKDTYVYAITDPLYHEDRIDTLCRVLNTSRAAVVFELSHVINPHAIIEELSKSLEVNTENCHIKTSLTIDELKNKIYNTMAQLNPVPSRVKSDTL